eukprot:TRINITY_DN310_c0_g1_i1.p1 TRINITY_DN310_c0_g1~~TRINITY_DN310_c0_g1_i1.p1  ORF type:complete len:408 (-),score=66.78 TRINITY_DN310_c0_g1_i1:22-1245(-)
MDEAQIEQLKDYFKDEIRQVIREEMEVILTENIKEDFHDLRSQLQDTINYYFTKDIKESATLNNSSINSTNYVSSSTKRDLEDDFMPLNVENKKRKTTDDIPESFTPPRDDTKYVSTYESDRKPLIDEDRDRLEKDDRRTTYSSSSERPLESRSHRPLESRSERPLESRSHRPLESRSERPLESRSDRPLESRSDRTLESRSDRPLESRDSTRRSEGDRETSFTSSSGRYSPRGDTHQLSSRVGSASGSEDRMWDSSHRSSSSSTYPKTSSSYTSSSSYRSDDYYRSKLPPVKDSHPSTSRLPERRRTPPPLSSSWKDSNPSSGSSYRSSSAGTGERVRGAIKSMLHYRGYGHIEHPDFPDGLWFSFSQVQFEPSELKLGDEVEFEIGHNGKAPCANNIKWASTRRY